MAIAESAAREKCEVALKLASKSKIAPQLRPASEPRLDDAYGRMVKAAFSAKNSRDIPLEFSGWCEVAPDGRTEIVNLIELAGRDFLASSQPAAVRDDYMQRVKITRSRTDAQSFTEVITNRNEFAIKNVEVSCRILYSGSQAGDDVMMRIGRIIPAGGSTKFQMPRAAGSQTVTCQTTDFLWVGSAERKLIEAFGPAGGQSSFARLREDAIRTGVPVDSLVEPFIAFAKGLAAERHRI